MPHKNDKFKPSIDFAFAELMREGGDVFKLPVPLRTVVAIVSGQAAIDNGGLQYFFEADFPGAPPYEVFIDAYREIGADPAARALADAVALFPFDKPNEVIAKRNTFMDSFNDEDGDPVNSPFEPYTRLLCGTKEVWDRLDAYILANGKSFGRS